MSNMVQIILSFLLLTAGFFDHTLGHSNSENSKCVPPYRRVASPVNGAKVARTLVHQTNWAAFGTISTNPSIASYPMVNIISVDDNTPTGKSTGKIHFLLTDLDFTGTDWKASNKVTLLFSDEQNLNCKNNGTDPMEPTCARAIISGKITELDRSTEYYADVLAAYIIRHPSAEFWMQIHSFYMCELDIENIFVMAWHSGPRTVTAEDYYKVNLENNDF